MPQYDAALVASGEETCRALCRIFTEMGEQYLHLILQNPQQWALPVVGAVLRGASHPDREVAGITFNFWYILSEELAGGGRVLGDGQRAACRELFVPAYEQLVDALRLLVEVPPDSREWTDDVRDDFKRAPTDWKCAHSARAARRYLPADAFEPDGKTLRAGWAGTAR